MKTVTDSSWVRRGLSLLWDSSALSSVMAPTEAIPLRQLFQMSQDWPDDLPSSGGNAVVAVGLEGALDCLSPDDAETWLETRIRPLLLSFQAHYQGQAGLHLWLPGGRQRVVASFASNSYSWRCSPPEQRSLPLGRLLWSGAESEALRILTPGSNAQEAEGVAWLGLHHRRVS